MPDQPPFPKIERITLPVCELCMKGDGEVCHVPECVFCRHDVIKDLKHFAIPDQSAPAFIVTEVEIEKALCSTRSHDPDGTPNVTVQWKRGGNAVNAIAALLNRANGRVIDVVALSMKCLAAVLNNEYMEKQLDGLQVAILNAIEGKENGE